MTRFSAVALRRLAVLGAFALASLSVCCPTLHAQAQPPYLLWPEPDPISFLSPLTGLQLDAVALSGLPVPISLQRSYNVAGYATPGTPFVGGFDGNGESFSAAQLGTSVQWRGVTFPLGPADAPDVVTSATVALPAGSYSSLLLLADLVNDEQPGNGNITVRYTDGSTSTVSQAFSDWVRARNNPGESTVKCVPNRVFFNGSIEPNSTCIYGYTVPLDSTKVVASVTLPNDRNIVVLSMALLPPIVPGTITYTPKLGGYPPVGEGTLQALFAPAAGGATVAGSVSLTVNPPVIPLPTLVTWPTPQPVSVGTVLGPTQLDATAAATATPVNVPLRDAARVNAFYHDNAIYLERGFDGENAAFSYQQLGPALQYKGTSFPLGTPDVQNAATSSTVQLPAGQYTTLDLLGAATTTSQPAQVFTIHYTDGTATTQTLDLSAWTASTTYPDETVVATTTMQDLADGTQRAATSRVYGYTLNVDSTRTVQSLTLPANPSVVILAAALGTGAQVPVSGDYAYTPPSGTALAAGDTALHIDFSPGDTADFAKSSKDVVITALRPVLTVSVQNATRPYGAANPGFIGNIAGALSGDHFTENFSTAATPLSAPGSYAITPSAAGGNLSGYQVQIVPSVLIVTRAASTIALSSPQASALQGTAATITATVNSTTTGTPTGTVTFLANGTAVGTAALSNGSATLVTSQLPVGSLNLTVTYAGDVNFLPASATPSIFSVAPRDFALTARQGTTLTGIMGSSPSLAVHMTPLDGTYSADATFSVSGDLPNNTQATFSPSTLPEQSGAADVVVTLHTRKYAGLRNPFHNDAHAITLAALLGLLPLLGVRRRRIGSLVMVLLGTLALVTAGGCGTGYADHTYHFQLTATTGTVSHSVPLTLQIEASPQ